jgi:dihydrofolate synthase/folylpolyglutamate synthase
MPKDHELAQDYKLITSHIDSRPAMPRGQNAIARMGEAFAREQISFPQDRSRVILVAGTNGKGSVARCLDTLLRASGYRVGLFTSPHLVTMRERIRIDGRPVTESEFVELFVKVKPTADSLGLTHFEILTLMAAKSFFDPVNPLDWFIFEIGMGGLWDPTNAIPHSSCVITALGMDHQEFLGDTIEKIATQKFGIVGQGAIVAHAPFPNRAVAEQAKRLSLDLPSRWVECIPHELRVMEGPEFQLHCADGVGVLGLPGPRGAANSALAVTLLGELGFSRAKLLAHLHKVQWPGRMQRIETNISRAQVYLSGDHNLQGMESLIELLQYYPRRRILALVGIAATKNSQGMLEQLLRVPDLELFLTSPPFKSRPLESYGEFLQKAKGSRQDPWEAFQSVAKEAKAGDLVLVTGSLYLIGDILARLGLEAH